MVCLRKATLNAEHQTGMQSIFFSSSSVRDFSAAVLSRNANNGGWGTVCQAKAQN